MNIHLNNRPILRDLGDGPILCRSTAGDVDCYYDSDETRMRLNTLFPRKASSVMFVN
jgi:hypothetical protein